MMEHSTEQKKRVLMKEIGVPYCEVFAGCGVAVILRAMMSRELGERAIASGDEVILVGTMCAVEKAALSALGLVAVCVRADGDAKDLEGALSPASKAVWVCADAMASTVRTVRNFCNALELWMLATTRQEARACLFDGKQYHVGAVADVATGRIEDLSFACSKDELPFRLVCSQLRFDFGE